MVMTPHSRELNGAILSKAGGVLSRYNRLEEIARWRQFISNQIRISKIPGLNGVDNVRQRIISVFLESSLREGDCPPLSPKMRTRLHKALK